MNIKNVKVLFQGKRKWIFIAAIVAVILIAFLTRKKGGDGGTYATSAFVPDYGAMGGGGGGGGGVTTNDVQNMVGTAVDNANRESERTFLEMLGKQQTYYDKQIDTLGSALSNQTEQFNKLSKEQTSAYQTQLDFLGNALVSQQNQYQMTLEQERLQNLSNLEILNQRLAASEAKFSQTNTQSSSNYYSGSSSPVYVIPNETATVKSTAGYDVNAIRNGTPSTVKRESGVVYHDIFGTQYMLDKNGKTIFL